MVAMLNQKVVGEHYIVLLSFSHGLDVNDFLLLPFFQRGQES